jgi:hypothetical protein
LLHGTRGLRREQQQAREVYFARLAPERRDELFELEVLLKGIACFANPRNHPGPPRRAPIVALDFREPLAMLRGGVQRVVKLARCALGERDRAFVFHRCLETLLPEDAARTRLVREDMTQATPEGSLLVLRRAFTNLAEVCDGLLRLERMPFRLFYATASVAQREVAENQYFNPLSALEFRPEFDRIRSPAVLELIQKARGEEAQRLVALAFLSLFRMLRYLDLLGAISADAADRLRLGPGRAYLVLAVLRSDARALASYLQRRSGQVLADAFEHELLRTPADELGSRYEAMLAGGHRLIEVRGAFECINANLRIELRKVFEHELPSPDARKPAEALWSAIEASAAGLRPALHGAILLLGRTLGAKLEAGQVFDDQAARRQIAERLRRNVWMFAQIVRAFAIKARHARAVDDRWNTVSSLQFVKEFLAYFRAMGYPLLRAGDYPRFAAFLGAMSELQDSDLLDPAKLERATAECEAFYEFLVGLFDQVGRREEIAGTPFDKRAAAAALRLYLGE